MAFSAPEPSHNKLTMNATDPAFGSTSPSIADAADAVQHDRIIYAAGYRAGLADGCQHTHPAVADSVARMFTGWDGAEAAHRRSVARFRAEHRQEART